jgi:hypothetical protein
VFAKLDTGYYVHNTIYLRSSCRVRTEENGNGKKRILAVDDNPDINTTIKTVGRHWIISGRHV